MTHDEKVEKLLTLIALSALNSHLLLLHSMAAGMGVDQAKEVTAELTKYYSDVMTEIKKP